MPGAAGEVGREDPSVKRWDGEREGSTKTPYLRRESHAIKWRRRAYKAEPRFSSPFVERILVEGSIPSEALGDRNMDYPDLTAWYNRMRL